MSACWRNMSVNRTQIRKVALASTTAMAAATGLGVSAEAGFAATPGAPLTVPEPLAIDPLTGQVIFEEPGDAAATYSVQQGDTLVEVAETNLGQGDRYAEIFALNKDRAQSDGARLSDPNVLRPGWQLEMPAADAGQRGRHAAPNQGGATDVSQAQRARHAAPRHAANRPAPDFQPAAYSNQGGGKHAAPAVPRPEVRASRASGRAPLESLTNVVQGGATRSLPLTASPATLQKVARQIVPAGQYQCYSNIIKRESGWSTGRSTSRPAPMAFHRPCPAARWPAPVPTGAPTRSPR